MKILVTTDFSAASLSALKVAVKLAKRKRNSTIRLSHAYKVPRIPSLPSEDYGYDVRRQNEIRTEIRKKLQAIAQQDFFKGMKVETQIVPHQDVEDLLEHKDNKNMDLIVCGVHGNRDWQRTDEGKHTEAIIRHATCPVLVVHESIKDTIRFDDIVFASDFSMEMYKAFPRLKRIFDAMGGKLHLVKVVTPNYFQNTLHVEKEMKDFAKANYLTKYDIKVFNDENIELGVLRYAYSIKADLIAMETHGHEGFMHLFKGSILESVAHHSEVPVLSIKVA